LFRYLFLRQVPLHVQRVLANWTTTDLRAFACEADNIFSCRRDTTVNVYAANER
ncbi:hypothetical protein CAPTEDRAFT_87697, partial [Capitella teleta]